MFFVFLEFEIKRQIAVLESGGEVANETRSYSAETKLVISC